MCTTACGGLAKEVREQSSSDSFHAQMQFILQCRFIISLFFNNKKCGWGWKLWSDHFNSRIAKEKTAVDLIITIFMVSVTNYQCNLNDYEMKC